MAALIFASLIAVKAALLVALMALAGRAVLHLAFGAAARAARDWPLAVAAGTMTFYVAAILARGFYPALAASAALAAGGAFLFWRGRRESVADANAPTATWWELALAVLVVCATVLVPVTEWDARSIWFYHAKVVFYDGFDPLAWRYVAGETGWSHPFYPKLLATLAGSMASLFGMWNDYLPKLALAVLAVPALLLGGRLFDDWRLRALFWLFSFAVVRRFMWNGYMDGLLAVWSAVAFLHALAGSVGAITRDRAVIVCAIALSVCTALKVEGGVIAACFVAGAAAAYALRWRSLARHWRLYLGAAAFLLVPYAVWRLSSPGLGIGPGWATLSSDYLARAASRLADLQAVSLIAEEMFRRSLLLTLALLGVMTIVLWRRCSEWRDATLAGALVLGLYCGALFFVYLGTPIDLTVHLETSVSRTMMPPRLWALAFLLAALSMWHGSWRTPA